MSIKLVCENCKIEQILPEEMPVVRLNDEAHAFFVKHATKVDNRWCYMSDVFIAYENKATTD